MRTRLGIKTSFCLSLFLCLVGCSYLNSTKSSQRLDFLQNELTRSLSEPTLKQIQKVVRTDMQFQKGCREENIDVKTCDFRNSLSVSFERFSCDAERGGDSEASFQVWEHRGVRCDYFANLTWPDGRKERVEVSSEPYEYGIIFMDELVVEHGWSKRLEP